MLLNATFNLPFPIIILTQMFREVPIELEEAAQVDGARGGHIPPIAVAARGSRARGELDSLHGIQLERISLRLFHDTGQGRPMSVMLVGAEQTRGVDYLFVGTRMVTMMSLRSWLRYVQRYIVRGLSLGAVKG